MIILITGSTSGIGWETLKSIYPKVTRVILPVRNLAKAKKMLKSANFEEKSQLFEMDLADLLSVKNAAEKIHTAFPKIDVMINNAGGMFPAGQKTKDGFDQSFQVNHLSHFLLTKTLIPNLLSAKAKVINVSSEAHRLGKVDLDDLGLKKSSNTLNAYSSAKLYNIFFSKSLKEKYGQEELSAYSLHPGAVKTAFGRDSGNFTKSIIRITQLFFISAKKGAETTVYLTLSPKEKLINSAYYVKKKVKSSSSLSLKQELHQKLWDYSEKCLNESFSD